MLIEWYYNELEFETDGDLPEVGSTVYIETEDTNKFIVKKSWHYVKLDTMPFSQMNLMSSDSKDRIREAVEYIKNIGGYVRNIIPGEGIEYSIHSGHVILEAA